VSGAESHEVATVLVYIGALQSADGDVAEGERQVMRAIEIRRKAGPAGERAVGAGWSALARMRLRRCDLDGARAAMREVEAEIAKFPETDWALAFPEVREQLASATATCSAAAEG
jgi:hypothetical protein